MRSNAREAALNIIFARQFNPDCSDVFKKKVYKQFALEKDDDLLFAGDIVEAVEEHSPELLAKIDEASHHYLSGRINPTDRSILMIALAEMEYLKGIPPVVSASEAAALARKYSTETSAEFVNGVLAGIINKKNAKSAATSDAGTPDADKTADHTDDKTEKKTTVKTEN